MNKIELNRADVVKWQIAQIERDIAAFRALAPDNIITITIGESYPLSNEPYPRDVRLLPSEIGAAIIEALEQQAASKKAELQALGSES